MKNTTSAKMESVTGTNMMVCMCCWSAFAEGVELELV